MEFILGDKVIKSIESKNKLKCDDCYFNKSNIDCVDLGIVSCCCTGENIIFIEVKEDN